MYGLKQAGEIWSSVLVTSLLSWKFKQSNIDPRVFLKKEGNQFVIIVTVVDDMMFVSNSPNMLETVKTKLRESFDVKFFGTLSSFIGWEIEQGNGYIRISQSRYTDETLTKHGLERANRAWTPLPSNLPSNINGKALSQPEHAKYRVTVGELLYLSVCTRPVLSFTVGFLARQVHAPNQFHLGYLKRVLRYLSDSRNLGIRYQCQASQDERTSLHASCDADWAGDKESRKSGSGFVVCLNSASISWKSRRQSIVALSSTEAEYISMYTFSKSLFWMRRLHWELQQVQPFTDDAKMPPTILYSENTAALSLAVNDQISAKSKHIEVRFHHIRQNVKNGVFVLRYIASSHQVADVLTKPVTYDVLKKLRPILLSERGKEILQRVNKSNV